MSEKIAFYVFVTATSAIVERDPREHHKYKLWYETSQSVYFVAKTVKGINAHIPRVSNLVVNHHMITSGGRAIDVKLRLKTGKRKRKVSDKQKGLL